LSLLQVEALKVFYYTREGLARAVDGVSLEIRPGESFGIIGESGCGKSTVALSILGLVSQPGRIVDGRVLFSGEDLVKKDASELQKIRGRKIAMVFQDPMTSLNPVLAIGDQIGEAILLHQAKVEDVDRQVSEALRMVGIPDPDRARRRYPHELSGGMRQRAMIAMALCCRPDLLIADEPTTALDVTIEAQILDLIKQLRKELGMALLLITHDLGIIAEMCDEVAVMYAGKIVEKADVKTIYYEPLHPYTVALLGTIPDPSRERLQTIKGSVLRLINPPDGCRFADRCNSILDICRKEEPPHVEITKGHYVACWATGPKGGGE